MGMAEEELSLFRIATGQRKLRGLFFETVLADKTGVVYTLKDRDHAGYPSLYRLYMEADDPTEYTFAVNNLDGWDHWEKLCDCNWFKPYIARWRRELEIRTKAKALMNMKALASDPTSKEFHQANKFLVNGGWKEGTGSRRGRPSKEEIQKETKRLATEASSLDDDLSRVTGAVN
jgi:hypothetical protein